MSSDVGNGWDSWKRLVLSELESQKKAIEVLTTEFRESLERKQAQHTEEMSRNFKLHHDDLKEVAQTITDLRVQTSAEIATLKVKAGIWGAVAGILPAIAALIWTLINQ